MLSHLNSSSSGLSCIMLLLLTICRAAAATYAQLLNSQSDNNVKLIVLERLDTLKKRHAKVLQVCVPHGRRVHAMCIGIHGTRMRKDAHLQRNAFMCAFECLCAHVRILAGAQAYCSSVEGAVNSPANSKVSHSAICKCAY